MAVGFPGVKTELMVEDNRLALGITVTSDSKPSMGQGNRSVGKDACYPAS